MKLLRGLVSPRSSLVTLAVARQSVDVLPSYFVMGPRVSFSFSFFRCSACPLPRLFSRPSCQAQRTCLPLRSSTRLLFIIGRFLLSGFTQLFQLLSIHHLLLSFVVFRLLIHWTFHSSLAAFQPLTVCSKINRKSISIDESAFMILMGVAIFTDCVLPWLIEE